MPAPIKINPTSPPEKIRIRGPTRLFSNAYFTKNTTPRKSARPPIHANNLTPTNDSQLMPGTRSGTGVVTRGDATGAGGGVWTNLGSGGGTAELRTVRSSTGLSR